MSGIRVPQGAAERLLLWRHEPHNMVRQLFGVEPDSWQLKELKAFPTSQRMALQACKGPGKTAELAWIGWNFMLTRPKPKVAATSITAENLSDCLWTEMAKWQSRSPLLQQMFEWNKTRIVCRQFPEEWWMSARSWSKTADITAQADTLAGLHADYLLFLLDETGSMPKAVMAAAEAALSTGIETHIVQAGNPTQNEGPLFDAATVERKYWRVCEITGDPDDPMRSPRIDIEWARKQIETYGRDDPWVRTNVLGKFPLNSTNALIGIEDVRKAQSRVLRPEDYASQAKIVAVDVARSGDDRSVIVRRQGLQMFEPEILRDIDGTQGAGRLSMHVAEWKPDAIFIDTTGGYGYAWLDAALALGLPAIGVQFGGSPMAPGFLNKRAEMLWELSKWIKRGGALPKTSELVAELTTPTYRFQKDKIVVEPKESVKKRLGRSPDIADSMALSFAYPVMPRNPYEHLLHGQSNPLRQDRNYDPIGRVLDDT